MVTILTSATHVTISRLHEPLVVATKVKKDIIIMKLTIGIATSYMI